MKARRLKKDRRWGLMKFCLITYIGIAFFTLIWLRNEVVSFEKEIGQLENKKTKLIGMVARASAERAKLSSVANVEQVARNQLGMGSPHRERIFTVKKTTGALPYKASFELISELIHTGPVGDLPEPNILKKNKSDKRKK